MMSIFKHTNDITRNVFLWKSLLFLNCTRFFGTKYRCLHCDLKRVEKRDERVQTHFDAFIVRNLTDTLKSTLTFRTNIVQASDPVPVVSPRAAGLRVRAPPAAAVRSCWRRLSLRTRRSGWWARGSLRDCSCRPPRPPPSGCQSPSSPRSSSPASLPCPTATTS